MNLRRLSTTAVALATALAIAALAGCGGNGGSSTTLTGFAAKGTLKFATVTAYAVQADGSVATTPAAAAVQTDSEGQYTLAGLAPQQQLLVKVTPNAQTRHADEITHTDTTLPANFVLSAVALPAAGGATVSITPFSHQVVVAAQKTGGLTPTNIAGAQAVVQELIGFDPVSIAKNDGSSTQAQQLKVLLTAVSQMAANGDLGCTSADPGTRTACVTEQLAQATSIGSVKLALGTGSTAIDVSSVLNAAVVTAVNVLAQTDSRITLDMMGYVLNQLPCDASCAAGPSSTASGSSTSASPGGANSTTSTASTASTTWTTWTSSTAVTTLGTFATSGSAATTSSSSSTSKPVNNAGGYADGKSTLKVK